MLAVNVDLRTGESYGNLVALSAHHAGASVSRHQE